MAWQIELGYNLTLRTTKNVDWLSGQAAMCSNMGSLPPSVPSFLNISGPCEDIISRALSFTLPAGDHY